jgi:hypothetical protein
MVVSEARAETDERTGERFEHPGAPAAVPEGPFHVAAAGGAVWVTSETVEPKPGDASLLWRVDAATNRFAGALRVGTVGRNHISPTVAAGGDGTAWVAVADADAVLRVRP